MKLDIKINLSPLDFIRKISYRPLEGNSREYSAVKSFGGGDYPRFHAYITQKGPGDFSVNLHLDQKKPSYSGSHAHSGEYDGSLVDGEARRIRDVAEACL